VLNLTQIYRKQCHEPSISSHSHRCRLHTTFSTSLVPIPVSTSQSPSAIFSDDHRSVLRVPVPSHTHLKHSTTTFAAAGLVSGFLFSEIGGADLTFHVRSAAFTNEEHYWEGRRGQEKHLVSKFRIFRRVVFGKKWFRIGWRSLPLSSSFLRPLRSSPSSLGRLLTRIINSF